HALSGAAAIPSRRFALQYTPKIPLQWAGFYYGLTNDADFVITVLIQLIQKAIMQGIFGQGTFGPIAVLCREDPFCCCGFRDRREFRHETPCPGIPFSPRKTVFCRNSPHFLEDSCRWLDFV
ncbi:MAG: hypothetical protein ACI3VX_08735, partial [Faecousia sp.]